ncbi:MAG: type II toxin-antitoxin system Phd/YefM family antitoxin [Bacillota bacterium]|nr:type II toxin-antitoxin system Phd/YefM family antitoxin [Bacillota bacterium]
MGAGGAVPKSGFEKPESESSLFLSKQWEIPVQQEQAQELKRSFGRVVKKLNAYRRLLINYRNKSQVVMLRLDDWNKIVERQQALEARLEQLEDLLEEVELAPEILRRAEANKTDPSRLLDLEQFMAAVREQRP